MMAPFPYDFSLFQADGLVHRWLTDQLRAGLLAFMRAPKEKAKPLINRLVDGHALEAACQVELRLAQIEQDKSQPHAAALLAWLAESVLMFSSLKADGDHEQAMALLGARYFRDPAHRDESRPVASDAGDEIWRVVASNWAPFPDEETRRGEIWLARAIAGARPYEIRRLLRYRRILRYGDLKQTELPPAGVPVALDDGAPFGLRVVSTPPPLASAALQTARSWTDCVAAWHADHPTGLHALSDGLILVDGLRAGIGTDGEMHLVDKENTAIPLTRAGRHRAMVFGEQQEFCGLGRFDGWAFTPYGFWTSEKAMGFSPWARRPWTLAPRQITLPPKIMLGDPAMRCDLDELPKLHATINAAVAKDMATEEEPEPMHDLLFFAPCDRPEIPAEDCEMVIAGAYKVDTYAEDSYELWDRSYEKAEEYAKRPKHRIPPQVWLDHRFGQKTAEQWVSLWTDLDFYAALVISGAYNFEMQWLSPRGMRTGFFHARERDPQQAAALLLQMRPKLPTKRYRRLLAAMEAQLSDLDIPLLRQLTTTPPCPFSRKIARRLLGLLPGTEEREADFAFVLDLANRDEKGLVFGKRGEMFDQRTRMRFREAISVIPPQELLRELDVDFEELAAAEAEKTPRIHSGLLRSCISYKDLKHVKALTLAQRDGSARARRRKDHYEGRKMLVERADATGHEFGSEVAQWLNIYR